MDGWLRREMRAKEGGWDTKKGEWSLRKEMGGKEGR
jgi:hypothetical protein